MDVDRSNNHALGVPPPAAVAVIAQSETTRKRVTTCLAREFSAVGRHSTLEEFIESEADDAFDVIVLCYERFGARQVAGVRTLKEGAQARPLVVVAKSVGRSALANALAVGLDGCVLEHALDDCLALTVLGACRGQVSLPREFSSTVSRPILSVREKQILALVVMGYSNAEIAQTLFVSESTVKSHLSSAFGRLGVRSRHEAAALILDPDTGLGTGILAISGDERRRGRA